MYRPTVRYDDVFKSYVDDLFKATHLDRNQIIRGALFAAAYSSEFQELLKPFMKKDVPLPSPEWQLHDGDFWKEQCPKVKERGKDVNVKYGGTTKASENPGIDFGAGSGGTSERSRRFESVTRPGREIPSERIKIKESGGITFTVN